MNIFYTFILYNSHLYIFCIHLINVFLYWSRLLVLFLSLGLMDSINKSNQMFHKTRYFRICGADPKSLKERLDEEECLYLFCFVIYFGIKERISLRTDFHLPEFYFLTRAKGN